MSLLRPFITAAVLLAAWEALVRAAGIPAFLLPPPSRVLGTVAAEWRALAENALFTAAAMLGGLALGIALGLVTAVALIASAAVRRWVLPLVVLSQAVPVFALAPLLVIWLGFDLPSKIAMVALVTYFPIALAFFEGMKRTDPGLLDLAALGRATRSQEIRLLRAPAALPALAAGLRGAAAAAPIGAIVGEWVGAAAGLGFLMIQANARMQTDMVFAALFVLAVMAITLWVAIDRVLVRGLPWAPDSVVRG
jgi:putative hydroxymethylpyrimidine transport system permease protein